MQAHTVLDSVAMVYTPLWNRARELAGVRVAVRATHPRGVDAPHLLQAIGEDWPEGAPPLVLALQTPRLLQQALSCPPVRNTWLEVPEFIWAKPEALELLRHESVDAILLDCQMPLMDGFATCRALRNLPGCADVPVLAITAHSHSGDRERCLAAGMSDYLAKPVKFEQLRNLLHDWVLCRES